jgi:hypothetical protein
MRRKGLSQASKPDNDRSRRNQRVRLSDGPTKSARSVKIVGVCRRLAMMAGRFSRWRCVIADFEVQPEQAELGNA